MGEDYSSLDTSSWSGVDELDFSNGDYDLEDDSDFGEYFDYEDVDLGDFGYEGLDFGDVSGGITSGGTTTEETTDLTGGLETLGGGDTTSGGIAAVDSYATEIPNAAKEGEPGYGWKYYSDGTVISPENKYYQNGKLLYDPTSGGGTLSTLGSKAIDVLKKTFTKDGDVDWRKVIGAGAGLVSGIAGLTGAGKNLFGNESKPSGYQGKIPDYTAVRAPVAGAFAPTKAGDPNRQYFSDMVYAKPL